MSEDWLTWLNRQLATPLGQFVFFLSMIVLRLLSQKRPTRHRKRPKAKGGGHPAT